MHPQACGWPHAPPVALCFIPQLYCCTADGHYDEYNFEYTHYVPHLNGVDTAQAFTPPDICKSPSVGSAAGGLVATVAHAEEIRYERGR